MAQLAKASDTQAVGREFKPCLDNKIGLRIIFDNHIKYV